METIAFLNVDAKSIYTHVGYLHFVGREGAEEAHAHHLSLLSIKRWKFLNDTLTVYFNDEEDERHYVERRVLGEEETDVDGYIEVDDDDIDYEN